MAGVQRVVVIGAGIVGAGAAARLAAAGARVTVVDNGAVGGATAAGAGIIATISSTVTDDETAAFRFAAARHYRDLLQRCADAGIEGGSYRIAGQLTVALRSAECEELQADFDRTRDLVARHGPDSVGQPELLTAGDIAARFPLVGPTFGGLLAPDVAVVDGRAMRDCLLRLAVSAGAEMADGTAELEVDGSIDGAAGVDAAGGRLTGVRTGPDRFDADAVVLAAGAWSGRLGGALAGRVEPQRGQILHLHLPGASVLPTLDTYAGHYLLTFPGDRGGHRGDPGDRQRFRPHPDRRRSGSGAGAGVLAGSGARAGPLDRGQGGTPPGQHGRPALSGSCSWLRQPLRGNGNGSERTDSRALLRIRDRRHGAGPVGRGSGSGDPWIVRPVALNCHAAQPYRPGQVRKR